jgi:hypothetical protein
MHMLTPGETLMSFIARDLTRPVSGRLIPPAAGFRALHSQVIAAVSAPQFNRKHRARREYCRFWRRGGC